MSKNFLGVFALLLVAVQGHAATWQLSSTQYETAKMPLEVIAPRTGLSTANRYYKAYPGLLYRVPVVVLGGAYPYRYSIVSGPTGMTVGQQYGDTDYGIINYPNPVAGSYTVTINVTDQQGTSSNVTWPLTVTSSGFIFIDAVNGKASAANGGTGTGTISNPFRTMDDFYSGTVGGAASTSSRKGDGTYAGYFVYYRAGTYSTSVMARESADSGQRAPFVSGKKPKVHLAYPGETVNIDTSGASIIFYTDSAGNYYFNGINFSNIAPGGDNKAWEWDSGVNDIGSFECTYNGNTASSGGGYNAALVMSRNGGSFSNYVFMSHNTITKSNNYDTFLGYYVNKFVAQNNTINNSTGGNNAGFYAKITNSNWSIRANTGLVGNSAPLYTADAYSTSNNIEVAWNNFKSSGPGAEFGLTPSTAIGNIWQYRNTWQVGMQSVVNVTINSLTVKNDVLTYTNSSANSHGWYYQTDAATPKVTATFAGEECVKYSSGCTDTSGKLTGSGATYFGLRGHEAPVPSGTTTTAAPPSAPVLTVQ
ncbi:MAG: hypothetical protein QM709_06510 [Spongiibacteraceae bacterium]